MSIRITCINKDGGNHYDPHEAIMRLGWIDESNNQTGKSTLVEMISFLEKGGQAYVRGASGTIASLVVRTSRFGNKYVKTIANGKETDNLLYLLECV